MILDTSVLIASERSGADLHEVLEEADEPVVAAVTLAEMLVGVALATGARRRRRARRIDELFATLPVEPYTEHVARLHADLMAATRGSGRPRGSFDLIIAATAAATARTVVSSDRAAFADLPGVQARIV